MKIVDLGMSGEGIARLGGKVYFVRGALPGEEVMVETVEERPKFCKARALEILKNNPDRQIPPCPYFGECGGCDIQHMSYAAQLEFKRNLVKNTIKKVAGVEVEVEPTVPSEKEFFYRNKSVFPIFEEGNKTRLGMFKAASHDAIEIKECKIAKEGINKVLSLTRDFFKGMDREGARYLVVRESASQFLITLVCEKRPSYVLEYVDFLKKNLDFFSFDINILKSEKQILSDQFIDVHGSGKIENQEFGILQSVNSASFMQINDAVKQKLYSSVLDEISAGEEVLDAYCGAGLLSAIIAKKAKFVYGIEIVKPAIESAKLLAKENNILNAEFHCGDCANLVPKILKKLSRPIVVLDPPRKGCDKKVLDAVTASGAEKIIYISCSPISLAQNLKLLIPAGYHITKLQPFDMFPQTANVETLCVLEKKG